MTVAAVSMWVRTCGDDTMQGRLHPVEAWSCLVAHSFDFYNFFVSVRWPSEVPPCKGAVLPNVMAQRYVADLAAAPLGCSSCFSFA